MPSADDIPACAWRRRLDERVPLKALPLRPNLPTLIQMAPSLARIAGQVLRDRRAGREPVLLTVPPKVSPTMGVPLGGLGGGTITRGWRGDFTRWQIKPGRYHRCIVPFDQFSLRVRREGEAPAALVLSPHPSQGQKRKLRGFGELNTWNWGLAEARTTYHALYPRAWTVYEEPAPGIRLVCRQVSPFLPGDYKESSYPVGVFVWSVENLGRGTADVALMFSFQNGTGGPDDAGGGHANRPFDGQGVVGVELRHRSGADPLTFAVAARTFDAKGPVEVTRRTTVLVRGRPHRGGGPADLWRDFLDDGLLSDGPAGPPVAADPAASAGPAASATDRATQPTARASEPGQVIGAAVCARVSVAPGEKRELAFALAWDAPVARFGPRASGTAWYRRYTLFRGRDGRAAPALAQEALHRCVSWEERIAAWQQPILADPDLPDWCKSLLFNELYYLADGGTIWTAGRADEAASEAPAPGPAGDAAPGAPAPGPAAGFDRRDPLPEPSIGHFAYLEGHEYLMYNTFDVHFTAAFALLELFPELELSLMRDFARAVDLEDPEPVTFVLSGRRGRRKVRGALPHDLGSPVEDPWRRLNAYNAQDTSLWKDLGPKFVLRAYHDWVRTGDRTFLRDMWETVEKVMAASARFDRDGDGLIENDGFPDQTYDVWSARGPSAYSGGLWLAALAAARAMAEEMGREERARAYRDQLSRAQAAYEAKLWNGSYYDYDAGGSRHHDSVMADQMCGPWLALVSGLGPVVPPDRFASALRRVFELNVMGWRRVEGRSLDRRRRSRVRPDGGQVRPDGGQVSPDGGFRPGEGGAVNGMRPDGRVDRTCLQSQEIWIGTTFTLAAAMLTAGMEEEAFTTARGVYLSVYRDYGLWFQTPEALTQRGVYRSAAYMRPLAVWAIRAGLEAAGPNAAGLRMRN